MNEGQLGFLDILGIMSFVLGLMNYEENLTQNDKQELMQQLNEKTDGLLREIKSLLDEIHKHLAEQDAKIDTIIKAVKK